MILLLLLLLAQCPPATDATDTNPHEVLYYQDGRKVNTSIVIEGTPDDFLSKKTIPDWIKQAKTARSLERRHLALKALIYICGGARCWGDPPVETDSPLAKEMAAAFKSFAKDRDAESRQLAARGLALTGVKSNLQAIVRMLNDPEEGIRAAAISALARSKDPAAVAALQKVDPSTGIRPGLSILALGEIGTPGARAALESLRKRTREPYLVEMIDREIDRIEGN